MHAIKSGNSYIVDVPAIDLRRKKLLPGEVLNATTGDKTVKQRSQHKLSVIVACGNELRIETAFYSRLTTKKEGLNVIFCKITNKKDILSLFIFCRRFRLG